MALELLFSGFFECRLATDPDPFDEPRGVSGWTFAVPGEPDLDRIIRFQATGAVKRWPCPEISVKVRRVLLNGAVQAGHPLVGANVSLADGSVFEGRNGLVAGSGFEPVFPFEMRIDSGPLSLRRAMNDPAGEPLRIKSAGRGRTPALLAEAGIDPVSYRAQRLQAITDRLAAEADAGMTAGLRKRKRSLEEPNTYQALMWGPVSADYFVGYRYSLEHPRGSLTDPGGLLGPVDLDTPWAVEMSCGAWDADVLVGYVSGKLQLP